ncbi:cobyric acid synthase CobQ [Rhizobium rhizosphaerae]|uniref:Cobyric acid synthase n=1 Tax=Xaviernesmea rhizosphaerae TaxID=1672749 RepID=A0ABX3PJ31_9HYPH|nr:cobyric acid synthase [Xaviernesmea rhizosphaerae]OQP88392.1 cobyric acid synthase CobQ [Xaviernesmea rhizosphaerae]
MTKAIMLQGTGSDVGKTVLVAGLCRLAARRGLKVAPFKPQNMSNNAAVTADGGEIGRAQWLQALAAGIPTTVHMNPVLLKPQSETGSQVIVQGRMFGSARGRDYQALKPTLMQAVLDSFARVGEGRDLVIVEGAGSPAEINLRAGDIANMGFATRAGVPVVLVGDIDRGGVIASIVGTKAVLPAEDAAMIQGFLINKFRGDVSLFDEGVAAITRHTGWPCFGVVPWLRSAGRLPAEDSVTLERLVEGQARALKIAVPVLPRIANFDDLDPLKAEPAVELVFVKAGSPLPADAALVVLAGSKATISDLQVLRDNGWDADLARHVRRGGRVIGLCGGYQMLGRRIVDPLGQEGVPGTVEGLGFLDVETELSPEKVLHDGAGWSVEFDLPLQGYEIHLGATRGPDCARAPVLLRGQPDGAASPDGRVSGTYLHGLFSSDGYRRALLARFGVTSSIDNYRQQVEDALDQVASELEAVLDSSWLERLFALKPLCS